MFNLLNRMQLALQYTTGHFNMSALQRSNVFVIFNISSISGFQHFNAKETRYILQSNTNPPAHPSVALDNFSNATKYTRGQTKEAHKLLTTSTLRSNGNANQQRWMTSPCLSGCRGRIFVRRVSRCVLRWGGGGKQGGSKTTGAHW